MLNTIKHQTRRNTKAVRHAQAVTMALVHQVCREVQAEFPEPVYMPEIVDSTADNADGLAFSADFAGIYEDR